MHPRSRSRAPITAASLRTAFGPQLVTSASPAPTPCAFHAAPGDSVIRLVRDIAVHFPLSGVSLNFAAGTTIELLCPHRWEGGDPMVIAATPLFTDRRMLVALPRRLNDPDDIVLGGFDLDASGAVLAGSFWDANLDDSPTPPADPVIVQMADYFVARRRDGFEDTTHVDLVREGFAETDIRAFHAAATNLATEQLRDADIDEGRTHYDRAARVRLGATALSGELDPNRLHTTLRLAGLSTPEIGKLFDEIIEESMRMVREAHASLSAAVPSGAH
jgi:hypothetical protein